MAKAKVVLGHFKWHDIQKGGFDAKKGGSVLRLQSFPTFPGGSERLSPLPSHLCVSSAALPLSISVCTSLCSFQARVPRFISTCRCCIDAAALVYCTAVRVGTYSFYSSFAPL